MKTFPVQSLFVALCACYSWGASMLIPAASAAGFDRPASLAGEGRSVTIARHGMVCTSQPLASQAGLDVLKRGGTAADAAIAA